jgi:2-(1,2-epoxy-1,2-dihydrophenyl)acetyl-CoA isomerase
VTENISSYQKISVEFDGDVGILRLNDPTRLNAISMQMLEEIDVALDELTRSARALIVIGNGKAFCSGAALDGGMGEPDPDLSKRDAGLSLETHINPMMTRLRESPIPWITAVRGATAGFGVALALAGDLVIASETAYFLQAFARVGLVPDGGATHLLVRTVGRVRAMELMLLAERLPAAQALSWGLVNRVVADTELEQEALSIAARLARGPATSLRLIREAAWQAQDADWATVLQGEREWQREAGCTQDFEEGRQAFLGKRTPVFNGR